MKIKSLIISMFLMISVSTVAFSETNNGMAKEQVWQTTNKEIKLAANESCHEKIQACYANACAGLSNSDGSMMKSSSYEKCRARCNQICS